MVPILHDQVKDIRAGKQLEGRENDVANSDGRYKELLGDQSDVQVSLEKTEGGLLSVGRRTVTRSRDQNPICECQLQQRILVQFSPTHNQVS